jgi:DNA-binding NarL/FixJ family response regulator
MREGAPSIRVAIADDHPIFRDGLKRLLESEPSFQVVAEGADGVDAIRLVREANPDVLLLDVAMPRMGGLETLSALSAGPTRVILLTAALEPEQLLQAIRLGARGVVLKESATRKLIEGIQHVMEGKILIGSDLAEDLADAVRRASPEPKPRPHGLTAREIEIVSAVSAGRSNREIAEKLSISLQTVKHHLTSVFDKTGVSTRLELALFAMRHGLAEQDPAGGQ